LEREQVKTVSKYDLQRSAKKKEMVAGSKRRVKKKELKNITLLGKNPPLK
jgi:hypothetical protein